MQPYKHSSHSLKKPETVGALIEASPVKKRKARNHLQSGGEENSGFRSLFWYMNPSELLSFEELQAQERELSRFKMRRRSRAPASQARRLSSRPIPGATNVHETVEMGAARGFELEDRCVSLVTVDDSFVEGKSPFPAVPHGTAWRKLCFSTAPRNLLLEGNGNSQMRPFQLDTNHSLAFYDISGIVSYKCKLGVAAALELIQDEIIPQVETKSTKVDPRVNQTVSKIFKKLHVCHRKQAEHIITSVREKVKKYKQELATFRQQEGCGVAILCPNLDIKCPVETHIAQKRLGQLSQNHDQSLHISNFCICRDEDEENLSEEHVKEANVISRATTVLHHQIGYMPKWNTYVGIRDNFLQEDDPILRYVPYVDDKTTQVPIIASFYEGTTIKASRTFTKPVVADSDDDSIVDNLISLSTIEPSDTIDADQVTPVEKANLKEIIPSAIENEIMECLLKMVIAECSDTKLASALNTLRAGYGFIKPERDFQNLLQREMAKANSHEAMAKIRKVLKRKRKSKASIHLRRLVKLQPSLCHRTARMSVRLALQAPTSSIYSNYADSPENGGLRNESDYSALVACYRDLFCRRCFIYDCGKHGIEHPLPSQRTDPVQPFLGNFMNGQTSTKLSVAILEDSDSSKSDSKESDSDVQNNDLKVSCQLETDSSEQDEEFEAEQSEAQRRRSNRTQTQIVSRASAGLALQNKQIKLRLKRHHRGRAKQKGVEDSMSEYLDRAFLLGEIAPTAHALLDPKTPCSDGCYIGKIMAKPSTTKPIDKLAPPQVGIIKKLLVVIGHKPCAMVRILHSCELFCWELNEILREIATSTARFGNASMSRETSENSKRKLALSRSYKNGSYRAFLMHKLRKRMQSGDHHQSYRPCNHTGPCTASCACVQKHLCCEAACSCDRSCINRFRGCKCAPGNCNTKSCVCFLAGRECDPDVCFSCGACNLAIKAFGYKPPSNGEALSKLDTCGNVYLSRGAHKKVGIAFSSVHGWGAFALESIRKGVFVYEYVGALLSDEEAQRCGYFYDRSGVSYLFDVNQQEVIDAARMGNKMKFANHRPLSQASLEAKIVVVRGEQRVAFFAKENIKAGQELFFDYGCSHAQLLKPKTKDN
uniref:Polycomblike protein putative n=1 Tax=Albugo laibachii Nc14 TaxID=890382 RepID=F0WUP3_9STRA|nr:polycomblike protein putative [Albugo laibachii Nc14]CCA25759.1 polycomblike protein putative [Albugo laibachii Nc14]|eukprot:CCA25759.1 polycomblike protein putative [Albugo laibachii Nc14]